MHETTKGFKEKRKKQQLRNKNRKKGDQKTVIVSYEK